MTSLDIWEPKLTDEIRELATFRILDDGHLATRVRSAQTHNQARLDTRACARTRNGLPDRGQSSQSQEKDPSCTLVPRLLGPLDPGSVGPWNRMTVKP